MVGWHSIILNWRSCAGITMCKGLWVNWLENLVLGDWWYWFIFLKILVGIARAENTFSHPSGFAIFLFAMFSLAQLKWVKPHLISSFQGCRSNALLLKYHVNWSAFQVWL